MSPVRSTACERSHEGSPLYSTRARLRGLWWQPGTHVSTAIEHLDESWFKGISNLSMNLYEVYMAGEYIPRFVLFTLEMSGMHLGNFSNTVRS